MRVLLRPLSYGDIRVQRVYMSVYPCHEYSVMGHHIDLVDRGMELDDREVVVGLVRIKKKREI